MAGEVAASARQVTYDAVMAVRNPIDVDVSADGSVLSVITQRRGDLVVPRLLRHGDPLPEFEFAGELSIIDTATRSIRATWDWPEKAWHASINPSADRVVALLTFDGELGLWSARLDGTDARRLQGRPAHLPGARPLIGWTSAGEVVVALQVGELRERQLDAVLRPPDGVTVDHLVNDPVSGLNAGAGQARPDSAVVAIDVTTGAARTIAEGLALSMGVLSPDAKWIACLSHPQRVEMSSFATSRSVEIRSMEDGRSVAASDVQNVSYNLATPVWRPGSEALTLMTSGAVILLGLDGSCVEIRTDVPFRCDRGGGESNLEPAWTSTGSHLVAGDTAGALWVIDPIDRSCRSIVMPDHEASVELVTGPHGELLTGGDGRFVVVAQNPASLRREVWSLSLDGDEPVQIQVDDSRLMGMQSMGWTTVGASGSPGNRCFYVSQSPVVAPEVHCLDGDGVLTQVSDFNGDFAQLALPHTERIWFNCDGERRTAFLYLPYGWTADQGPLPFVVDAYPAGDLWGRSADTTGDTFRVIPPALLTAQGWGVLVVGATPPRDSDTRLDMVSPVLAAVDAAATQGFADDRVALVGQSAGGYLVNCAVTATDRFRAAIAFNGLANLSTHFGQLYVGPDGPLMHGTANAENMGRGTPWSAPERYVGMSPLFHLDHVETPLLLVQGTGDMFAMVQGADEMFVGLRRLGKYVEILRYHGEGHGPPHYTEPNRSHLYERVVGFLAEHLA